MERSRKKMRYLGQLGITTKANRKDLEFDRIWRRRIMMREGTLSPETVGGEKSPPLRIPTHINPDDLCREVDYPEKSTFLSQLRLNGQPKEKRCEKERIQRACEEERLRRLGMTEDYEGREITSAVTGKDIAMRGLKRKHGDITSECSLRTGRDVDREQKHGRKHSSHQSHASHSKSILFSDKKEQEKKLSRDFAQEFHESVLQSTRQKSGKLGLYNSVSEEDCGRSEDTANSSLNRRRLLLDSATSTQKSSAESQSGLRWPGIEAVFESYQKYCEELKLEKKVLWDRCRQLKSENLDLEKNAKQLSIRMSDLLEGKRQVDKDRRHKQRAIENLKMCLKPPR